MDWQPLIDAATAVREHAHAPYSGFRVGAALLLADGSIVVGCNVENRLLGLSVCAERHAVAQAVAVGGARRPLARALAVVTDSSPPAPPCGLCRETLAEFLEDLPILLANPSGERVEVTLDQLLPHRFVLETGAD